MVRVPVKPVKEQLPLSSGAMSTGERNVMVNATFVHVMICVTIAVVLAMTALIFYRSQTVTEPTAAIVISGDRYEVGATIAIQERDSVMGVDGHDVVKATFTDDNQFVTPILVEPGEYRVLVTAADGEVLVDEGVAVGKWRMALVDLPASVVVIGSSSLPDVEVVISGEGRKREVVTLSAENNYRKTFHRPPGNDQLIVTRNGKVLLDQEVTIGAKSPSGPHIKPIVYPLIPRYPTDHAESAAAD